MQSVRSNSNHVAAATNPYPHAPLMTGPTTSATETHNSEVPANPSKQTRIPRPLNCFLVFRAELEKQLKEDSVSPPLKVPVSSIDISCIAGYLWNQMSEKEKEPYRAASKKKFEEHKIAHPEYKFQARKRKTGKNERGVSSGTAKSMRHLSRAGPQGPSPPYLSDQYRQARQQVYHPSAFSPSTVTSESARRSSQVYDLRSLPMYHQSSSASPESSSDGDSQYVALSEYYFSPPTSYFSHNSSQLRLWDEPHVFTTPLAPHFRSSDPFSWQPVQIQNEPFTADAQSLELMGFFSQ